MRRGLVVAGIAIWFCGVVIALLAVWQYKSTPGAAPTPPEHWPTNAMIRRTPGKPDVILFAHPQCPCTRASITELARLADELDGSATIHVVLVKPDATPDGFEHGAIAERAAAIAGVDIFVDVGGHEATLFGAIVSGSTVVYAPSGELLFRGGLTTARGHEGRGPAHDQILALIAGRASDGRDAPTFGCVLADHALTASGR